MKWLVRILVSLVVLLGLAGMVLYGYLLKQRPKFSGELELNGLAAATEVYFDDYGVPHIYAESADDAYFVLGYLHARDRLFQMEMLRRASSGRLSEVLGPDLLEVDKLFRTLGLNQFAKRHAEKYLAADTAGFQRAVFAYQRGVNTFVREENTPIEFTLIGIPKTEFVPEDVYYVIGFMALGFAEGFELDPVLEKIHRELGSEYLVDLAIESPADAEIIPVHLGEPKSSPNKLISSLRSAFQKLPVPMIQGSNGWVISGERSVSGAPILVNDTHIGFSQPAVWYEAHLEYPGFSFYGHHLAGLPFGILGNNRFCAWGMTMFENDDVDFFRETINPADSNQVRFGDSWEQLRTRNEIIRVKDQPDYVFEVRESRHGPIVNGIVENVSGEDPIALSWLLLQQDNHALEAAYQLNRASTFEEAQNAIALFSSPGLNLMYGDTDGNIGWWAAARLPRRPPHVQSKLFLDGSSGRDEYAGFYDFNYNPKSVNPPAGFVYSANNQPDSIHGVAHAGYYFPRSRAGRIVELLSGKAKLSVDDMKQIDLDHVSAMHADIAHALALLADSTKAGEKHPALIKMLRDWDGDHAASSATPAVYYNVLSHTLSLLMKDELGETAYDVLLKTALIKNSILILFNNANSPWWDIVSTPNPEVRTDIIAMAFDSAQVVLEKTMGTDPANWAWGKVHTLTHEHALGSVKPLDRLFNVGPFPVAGGSEVINNLDFRYSTDGYFNVDVGPALRKITDFSNIASGITVSPTGQSGNVMSPHYSDQAKMFVNGEFRPMLFDRDDIVKATSRRLALVPAR